MRSLPTDPPERRRIAALLVALVAGVAVFAIATRVFPYHSINHDEGVYLQQAAMLLEEQLRLFPGELSGAFRPWFFVEDGGTLYPKYSPVPAAMYAASMALFGEPRVTLAAVAAGNALCVYALGAMAFDRSVGVAAAAIFAAAPMALVTTSVFLPYAPTTLLNLLFAVCYLSGVRTGSRTSAALAGVAIGLAFFARPYTAVLFAAPFIAHALWSVVTTVRKHKGGPVPDPLVRNALTAGGGLAFVGLTLAYNASLTGSALVFPYAAFAPMDGPGFGRRRLLEHAVEYTPALAAEANGYVLWYLLTRWFTAGALGTACAVCGLALSIRRWYGSASVSTDRTPGLLLVGLFVSIPVGNLLFWGNYNVLATFEDPTDGLIAEFGPLYHFDLLAPLSIFAALAIVTGWRRFATRVRALSGPSVARAVLALALLVGLALAGIAAAPPVAEPIERNAAHTEKYETAYEPIEATDFDGALVFLPTPYGEWQNHPFQYLRNDPGLDGEVVYALDREPAEDFAVLDAYPDRDNYRYAYRGEWTPDPDDRVTPKLEALSVRSGEALAGETTVGVPANVDRATVRLEADGEVAEYGIEDPGEQVVVDWTLEPGAARLGAVDSPVGLGATEEVVLSITLVQPDGSTLTYRQETAVRGDGERVEAIAPPERTVCPLVTRCGSEGTYLPDTPDAHREGVAFETRIEPA
ncbi:ArnT family glycosyltransferase [Halalkalicoccus jeotgali]|uniref:Uncharacterized protein n=1 Tax=Halalkalicoccus jeotgali (strain DSM 18796 / CECT 7217 / JCM 14584 / KCTC 4019 / B3) TaxID=795797 RepID=D8J3K3_HALJB|nr:glycosyltransferase family 39 protein [Halalkalicoccus jeotgali]ADJ15310.1 hypothetical protein HacjB3_09635 [Halalkalicoccus jeotgali B3]ELY35477.1 hypothetical protein C497_13041 [Halalkalicoccus jeotgali B3]